jgi:hypothetical protein
MTKDMDKRAAEFKRNFLLEKMLKEINELIEIPEKIILKGIQRQPDKPIIFIVGALRSGTTLTLQWLANTGIVAYPTNFLSRFFKAPIIGAKLQLLLTDERYNFRDELKDFAYNIDYESNNGKTRGVLAPNEFWYFWRRFLPFNEIDYLPTKELFERVDTNTLVAEFAGLTEVFQKPFALKGLILNYNIDFLYKLFPKSIFIYTQRNPLTNIESVLKARERQLGTINEWYSFKIPEYESLKNLNPYEQVAGQIYYINKAVNEGLERIPENNKLIIPYEDFCDKPENYFYLFNDKLKNLGYSTKVLYSGPKKFQLSRLKVENSRIYEAVKFFYK